MTNGFCEQCGAKLDAGARFCPECGATAPEAPAASPPPPPRQRRRWPWRRIALIAAPLVLLLAGGAVAAWVLLNDAPEDSAVALVPADARFYGTAFLNPSVGQKRAVKAVLDRAREAGAPDASTDALEREIGDALEDESDLSYERDVKPQLGDQIAIYSQAPGEDGGDDVAVLVATDDPQASLRAMRRLLADEYGPATYRGDEGWKIVQRRHRDQPYEVAVPPSDYDWETAFGFTVVDGFVVVGPERSIVASLDARAGQSLEDDGGFADVRDRLSGDVLAFAYASAEGVEEALAHESGFASVAAGTEPMAMTLAADDDRLMLDVAGSAGDADAFDGSSDILRTLPADSLVAVSFGDVGGILRDGTAARAVAELQSSLDDDVAIDVQRDFGSWLGDVGGYMRGATPDSIEGAVVAETRSGAESDRVLDQIESEAAENLGSGDDDYYDEYDDYDSSSVTTSGDGLGFDFYDEYEGTTLHVRGDDDRVVAGLGAAGFDSESALDASGGFGDSEAYRTAERALGGGFDPFLVLDAPPLESLLAQATDDGDYSSETAPWLRSIATIAGGARDDGDGFQLRLVVELRGDDEPSSLSGE